MSGSRPTDTSTHSKIREIFGTQRPTSSSLPSTNRLLAAQGQDRARKIEAKLPLVIAPNKSFHVTIVGGGEAGTHSALSLAKMKNANGSPLFYITILEKKRELMWGTSKITPGRAGQGYHYAHEDTSLMCQEHTSAFMQQHPNCVIGSSLAKDHPIRRGRYVVMKDSDPDPMTVLEGYKKSHMAYQKRVEENVANKIWGEPDNFLKVLYVAKDQAEVLADAMAPSYSQNKAAAKELQKIIKLDKVAFVVETAEELIDMKRYRKDTLDLLSSYDNVQVMTETEVLDLEHTGGQHFTVRLRDVGTGLEQVLKTDYPVICAAERAEYLLKPLNITSNTTEATTNRLKCIITVELPEELKNSNSYFFCMGPYMMLSNMGDGTAKITYAPVTNMGKADAAEAMPKEMEIFLNGQASEEEKYAMGEKIRLGAATNYMPLLAKAKLKSIDFGVVKVRGAVNEVTIDKPQGKIGERDYGWVRKHTVGKEEACIVQNDAMKIVYSGQNGNDTRYLIMEDLYLRFKKPSSKASSRYYNGQYNSMLLNLLNNNPSPEDLSVDASPDSDSLKVVTSPLLRPSNAGMTLRPPALLFQPNRIYTPTLFEQSAFDLNALVLPYFSDKGSFRSFSDNTGYTSSNLSMNSNPSTGFITPPASPLRKSQMQTRGILKPKPSPKKVEPIKRKKPADTVSSEDEGNEGNEQQMLECQSVFQGSSLLGSSAIPLPTIAESGSKKHKKSRLQGPDLSKSPQSPNSDASDLDFSLESGNSSPVLSSSTGYDSSGSESYMFDQLQDQLNSRKRHQAKPDKHKRGTQLMGMFSSNSQMPINPGSGVSLFQSRLNHSKR